MRGRDRLHRAAPARQVILPTAVADVCRTCASPPPPHPAAQRRGLALLFLTPPHPLPQGRSWRISLLQLHAAACVVWAVSVTRLAAERLWGRAGLARSDRARGNSKFVLFDIKKMWVSISEPAPAESHATQTSRLCGVCGPAGGRRRGGARGIYISCRSTSLLLSLSVLAATVFTL